MKYYKKGEIYETYSHDVFGRRYLWEITKSGEECEACVIWCGKRISNEKPFEYPACIILGNNTYTLLSEEEAFAARMEQ